MRAIVIGTGFGGLGAAHTLKSAGVEDVTILERADAVGGTWRDNTYPGAACDIPAHLYSFSFATSAHWSCSYPRQPEIRAYLESVTDELDLRRHIVFDADVTEARYDEGRANWTVRTADGRRFEAELLVGALGPFPTPCVPDIPGREDFGGATVHSARWAHDVDLTGKRVAVVGTGASAIQFIPEVAKVAGHVTVFQRTPAWVMPRGDRRYSRIERALLRIPWIRRLYRSAIYWQKEVRVLGFRADAPGMRLAQRVARWNMRRAVVDPALRRVLTPDYAMGCKRILLSNDYYPALAQPHVAVETTAIARLTPGGVELADGRHVEADVVLWGTGFDLSDLAGSLAITGVDDRDIREAWDPHPRAYLGSHVPGFPNLFLIVGPNTGLGHNSMIHMMESQFQLLRDQVRVLQEPGIAALDVREETVDAYLADLHERHAGMVWATGCRSWYLAEDGTNFTLWPGSTVAFRRATAQLDLTAYDVIAGRDLEEAGDRRRRAAAAS